MNEHRGELPQESGTVLLVGASELRSALRRLRWAVRSLRSIRTLLESTDIEEVRAVVLSDGILAGEDVARTIQEVRRAFPLVDVVVWSRRSSVALVRDCLRAGARDVMTTTSADSAARGVVTVLEDQQLLPRAAKLGEDSRTTPSTFSGMVSRSPRMWDLFDTAVRVANADATVLILGETGTGKELLARAIHERSGRPGRFVAVNCGAVQDTLIDSELFGHVEGAFTGATTTKKGLFRHADGGTVMLDEIGNIPLSAQHRLLRVLQEGAVRPVGGESEEPVDSRVIAATSGRLEEAVERGSFREDLFYRLDVIRLELPPLRERKEDIIYLFGYFAREVAAQYNVSRPDVTNDFLDALVSYGWPGNVRQLQNFTERFVLTRTGQRADGDTVREMLPFQGKAESTDIPPPRRSESSRLDTRLPMAQAIGPRVDALEREYLEACLGATRGRVGEAAEHAGISRRTLLRKMKRLGLDKVDYRAD